MNYLILATLPQAHIKGPCAGYDLSLFKMPPVKKVKRRSRPAKQRTVCPIPRMISVAQMDARYPDDMAIVTLFQSVGIFHESRVCEQGHTMKLDHTDKRRKPRWRCRRCPGDPEYCVVDGTFYEGRDLALRTILHQLYFWASGSNQTQLATYTGIQNTTLLANLRGDLRAVCSEVNAGQPVFGGTWYIDETLVHKDIVLGGILKETGKCFARIVEDRSSDVMIPVIEEHVARGSLIQTDKYSSYKPLASYGRRNWKHQTVTHSQKVYKDPITGACTNTVEGWWRALKHEFEHHSKHDLAGFISEFVFKRNARPTDPFCAILKAIGALRPPGDVGTYRKG